MSIHLLFFILLTIFMSNNVLAKVQCGQKSIIQLDENVRRLSVLGDADRKYPTDDKEALSHCKEDHELTSWGKNYTDECLKGRAGKETTRAVTNLLMYSMSAVSKKRCKNKSMRSRFIDAGKCGNLVQKDTLKCFREYSMESEQINIAKDEKNPDNKRTVPEEDLLPLICCAYHKFFQCCAEVYSDPKYEKTCHTNHATELETYTKDSLYNVIQYLCTTYEGSSDQCDKLRIKHKNIFSSVRIKSVPKSPLSSSNEVFDSVLPFPSQNLN